LKEIEILSGRINTLQQVDGFVNKYYSNEWVRRKILRQSDEEIQEIDQQINDEMQNTQYNPSEPQAMSGENSNTSPDESNGNEYAYAPPKQQ